MPSVEVHPRDQASDVPTDAAFIVDAPMSEIGNTRLADSHGVTVAVSFEPHQTWTIARPVSLSPNESYTFTIETSSGDVVTHIATGSTTTSPSSFSGLSAFSADFESYPATSGSGCYNTCVRTVGGTVSRWHLSYADPGSDIAVLEIRNDSHALISEIVLPAWSPNMMLGQDVCGAHLPALAQGQSVCARVVAYTQSGERVETSDICTSGVECTYDVDDYCSPTASCLLASGSGSGSGSGFGSDSDSMKSTDGCNAAGGGTGTVLLSVLWVLAPPRRRRQ